MKHMSKLHSFFSICLLFSAMLCAFSSAASGETLTCIVPDGQYVNVRNQASSAAATWGILHTGDTIDTNPAEIRDGFFKTTFKDRIAYVSVKYFEIPVGGEYVVEANGRVRMRKSPGGTASGFIKPGTRVYVSAWRYGADGKKWARCTGGSYISSDYLRPLE